jgi:hypothetical protein
MAVPFVQGQLRGETLSFVIETECGHCHQPFQIEIDSELHYRVEKEALEPLVYSPLLDVQKLEPSIIDGF